MTVVPPGRGPRPCVAAGLMTAAASASADSRASPGVFRRCTRLFIKTPMDGERDILVRKPGRAQERYSSHVRVRRVVTFLAIWLGAIATSAAAQDRRWEVEGSVGLVAARTAGDGTWTLPPAGGALVTSSPTSPTRQVPSWFFGDGASLLNGVSAQFGISARIAPLE